MKNKTNPGIMIVGGFFGNKKGLPTTQAEELKKLLQRANIPVYFTSRYHSRILRLFDTFFSLVFYSRRYQIVNIQFYGGLALILEDLASMVACLLGKTIVFTLHSGALLANIKKKPNWYLRVLRRATVVTCPSLYLIEALREYGIEARLIENSIPLHAYTHLKKDHFRPRLLWMRAFHPVYHPEMALDVLNSLKARYPDVILHMAGTDYGYEAAIRNKAIAMGLEKYIHFEGYIDQTRKNELARDCDIYLCTNRVDNAPVSLIEMLALGLAVVSTNAGGIPQLVNHGREVLLVPVEDVQAMADAVANILEHPILGKTLAANGYQLVGRYDEPRVSEKWVSLLTEMNSAYVRYSRNMAI